jgi:hypothetical protein
VSDNLTDKVNERGQHEGTWKAKTSGVGICRGACAVTAVERGGMS